MAISQVSQITVRKGLQDDLPQLAGGEFGWAIDTSNLYIGNGTLAEGAPAVGVTQILTAGSALIQDLVGYQYRGAGNIPVRYTEARTVPDKLQETVSVKDFFAVGDGVTDDSAAFQTAMQYLYSYGTDTGLFNSTQDPRLRKILFVPAGNYLVGSMGNINIPSYCTLAGEGANSSRLLLGNVSVVTVSSVSGAVNTQIAQNIALQDLGLIAGANSAVRIINATNVALSRVAITGPGSTAGLAAGVELQGSANTGNVVLSDCSFTNLNSGVYSAPPAGNVYSYVSVRDSVFDNLANAVQFPNALGNITGVSVTRNIFRNITRTAQIYGNSVSGIISGENIHIGIGNDPTSGLPTSPVIDVYGDNFSSFGDIFDRSDASAADYSARIRLNNSRSVAMDGTESLILRNRRLGSADSITLSNTVPTGAQILYTLPTINGITDSTVTINYTLTYQGYRRQGTVNWTTNSIAAPADTSGFSEEYNDNSDTPGIGEIISFSLAPRIAPYAIEYTSDVVGANLIYSIDSFNSQN